ncbi:MAG TPA: hypothetical protein VNT03_06670 [Baekduia sp.]|nr:hypothetical protein [Baekduia sp.]
MNHRLTRRAASAIAVATIVLGSASTASAGVWTPTPSGTTADITAVAYGGAGGSHLIYGTSSGQILKDGLVRSTNVGFSVRDIAFNPAGTVGLAAMSNGGLMRSADGGDSWSLVPLNNTTWSQSPICSATPSGPVGPATPGSNLNAVAWKDGTTAYVVGDDRGMVLKTANAGLNWADTSRLSNNTCRVNTPSGDRVTDVKTIPGTDFVWIVDDAFGATSVSSNGITSTVARRSVESSVNCFDHRPQLALDPDSPNRAFMVDTCSGNLAFGSSSDGGSTWDISQNYFAGDGSGLTGLNDIAIAGGATVAVGNSGAILVENNGRDAYFQRADGLDATNDWLSVAKRDATTAAVGGASGRLLTTTQATTIPDIVAPSGTVTGPVTAVAGVPQTYTANVADNAGGTGIDTGSFAWTATGVPAAGGNPATLTFPSAGFYSVHVAFKDLAGNAAEASLAVSVSAPTTPPVLKPGATTKTTSATVPGARITFGVPKGCVSPGQTFAVTLTWKKQKRKGNRFVKVRRADFYIGTKRVKSDKKAPFRQTLTVKAGTKPGSTVTVKARAFIKVTRGKSPTKSITSSVKVCG